jgi:hypothetical protein
MEAPEKPTETPAEPTTTPETTDTTSINTGGYICGWAMASAYDSLCSTGSNSRDKKKNS